MKLVVLKGEGGGSLFVFLSAFFTIAVLAFFTLSYIVFTCFSSQNCPSVCVALKGVSFFRSAMIFQKVFGLNLLISFSFFTRRARVGDCTLPIDRKFFPRLFAVSEINLVKTAPQARSITCRDSPALERS